MYLHKYEFIVLFYKMKNCEIKITFNFVLHEKNVICSITECDMQYYRM